MCMTFIYINPDPNGKYKLILLNNRDEFFARATSAVQWNNGVLGGIDEQDPARGTWLGMDAQGRIGVLLSITQPAQSKNPEAPSRGSIPCDFLRSNNTIEQYCNEIIPTASKYNGFQFVALEQNEKHQYELSSLTNLFVDKVEQLKWSPGVHVIGNSPPKTPYKKTVYGQERMEEFAKSVTNETTVEEIIQGLLDIATDGTSNAPDPLYHERTGRDASFCEPLCSIFVRFPSFYKWGTRSHSIIIVDKDNHATFYEKRMDNVPEDLSQTKWSEKSVEFDVKSN